jgi:hypothetical protein
MGMPEPFVDEYGSGGLFAVPVLPTTNMEVFIEQSLDLTAGPYTNMQSSVFSFGDRVDFQVAEDDLINSRFFRARAQTAASALSDDGVNMTLDVTGPTPVTLVMMQLCADTGLDIFPQTLGDLVSPVLPQSQTAENPEDLLAGLGIGAWVLPPGGDDTNYASRLPPTSATELQSNPLPDPCPTCTGDMDLGWPGDSGFPLPGSGLTDPPDPIPNPPDPSILKPFHPTNPIPEIGLQVSPTNLVIDTHLRIVVEIDSAGIPQIVSALQPPGDALLAEPPRTPGLGALVCVVSYSAAGGPGAIYQISTYPNPFTIRAYEPPEQPRASHGILTELTPQFRVSVALDPLMGTSGLTVDLYQYVSLADTDELTPDGFARNLASFGFLGSMSGPQIDAVLGTIVPPPLPPCPDLIQLHSSGPKSEKFNFVIMGDGFDSSQSDQDAYNDYVDDKVMADFLPKDVHPEILNGINIFRMNLCSFDSGVTQVNSTGAVTVAKNTALQYRYSGKWNRCWMEKGANTEALIQSYLDVLIPEADGVAVVLNQLSKGGCARSTHFAVTRTSQWSTFAHEFGHFFGEQGDEYQCDFGESNCSGVYTNSEPAKVNLTKEDDRNALKWKIWVPPFRPVPTILANIADEDQDVGLFPGGTVGQSQWWNGLFRPSWRSRMNNNTPPHNPVGYTEVRNNARIYQEGDFRKSWPGDFNGDGFTDVVIIDDRQLSLYLAADRDLGPDDPIINRPPRKPTGVLEPTWYLTDILRNDAETKSWEFRSSDILLPGDFDGDGTNDLYVVNLDAWTIPYLCMLKSHGDRFEPVRRYDLQLPGWDDMRGNDEFYVGDYTGDGKDDLMVYNGVDWDVPYFILLRSTGTSLQYTKRYDQYLPPWEMGRHEKFYVGNFDGDASDKVDVVAHDTGTWSQVHMQIYKSDGVKLQLMDRHYGTNNVPGSFWSMRRPDKLHVADFNQDGRDDIVAFNGWSWNQPYLGLLGMDADEKLRGKRRYAGIDNPIPGWDMKRNDRFYPANVDGDGDDDLAVFNGLDWSREYLGILKSDGTDALTGSWQKDWIGGWDLGPVDSFHVADFRGDKEWVDLFIYNKNWFGLLRSYRNRYVAETIYPKWIHNHRYHGFGWW